MIVSGAEFAATLDSRGFDFFSGVPLLADRRFDRDARKRGRAR